MSFILQKEGVLSVIKNYYIIAARNPQLIIARDTVACSLSEAISRYCGDCNLNIKYQIS